MAAQVYRNIQNYQLNKERFINDVQQILDLSVEAYFADKVKDDFTVYTSTRISDTTLGNMMPVLRGAWSTKTGKALEQVHINRKDTINEEDALAASKSNGFKFTFEGDSILSDSSNGKVLIASSSSYSSQVDSIGRMLMNEISLTDSLHTIKGFAQKVIISLTQSDLDFALLTDYVNAEMERKGLNIDFILVQYNNQPSLTFIRDDGDQRVVSQSRETDTLYSKEYASLDDFPLESVSKSTYFSKNQLLGIRFENASLVILKRGGVDLMISLLMVSAVIGSLMYLYNIITEQKALAEIKNDLISNITHEFKTPIATISTALEGILNFNQANDPAKTVKYLDISKDQLRKLNGMVEKLLETASLDSDELEISKEEIELVRFTKELFDRFHLMKGNKQLSFQTDLSEQWFSIDPFHMENAIANLIDNAIKYGGDEVLLKLTAKNDAIIWEVSDNGGGINKQEQQRIFDKFYRIPTGNVHNVKGFGIGLYYTKTLVEKHGGTVSLKALPNATIFTISIDGKA